MAYDQKLAGRIIDDQAAENERLSKERNELYGYVNGLLGLLQLVRGRDDMPKEIAEVLRTNHRAVDAASYLTQIVPPKADEQDAEPRDRAEKLPTAAEVRGILKDHS